MFSQLVLGGAAILCRQAVCMRPCQMPFLALLLLPELCPMKTACCIVLAECACAGLTELLSGRIHCLWSTSTRCNAAKGINLLTPTMMSDYE